MKVTSQHAVRSRRSYLLPRIIALCVAVQLTFHGPVALHGPVAAGQDKNPLQPPAAGNAESTNETGASDDFKSTFGELPPPGMFSARSPIPLTGKLVFGVEFPTTRKLYTLDLLTSSVKFLGINDKRCGSPAWSPDGSQVAVSCDQAGGVQEIFLVSALDGTVRQLTAIKRKSDDPSWSADGSTILFAVRSLTNPHTEVYSVSTIQPSPSPSGSGEKRPKGPRSKPKTPSAAARADIQTTPTRLTKFGSGLISSPVWLNDGQTILFSTNRHWPGWDLCTARVTSGAESCITKGSESFVFPVLGHNGSSLVVGIAENNSVRWEIMDLHSRQRSSLPVPSGTVRSPAWSPDDRFIAVVTTPHTGDHTISVISLKDKTTHVILTSGHPVRGLDWWDEKKNAPQ